MVVSETKRGHAAADAIEIQEREAFSVAFEFLWDWKPASDVWPLTKGFLLCGATAGLSGVVINNHFRRWLRLGRAGRFSSYGPVAIIPAVAAAGLNLFYVTKDVILSRVSCPVCLELRSVSTQVAIGFAYPMVLGPLGALQMARGYRTYPVPRLLKDFPEVVRIYKKFCAVGYWKIVTLFTINLVLAIVLPYLQLTSHAEWTERVLRLEADFDKKVASGEFSMDAVPTFTRESTVYPPLGSSGDNASMKIIN